MSKFRLSLLLFAVALANWNDISIAQSKSNQSTKDPIRPPAITTQNIPPVPAAIFASLQRHRSTRSATFRGWAPDGRGILVRTEFGENGQLHRVYEPGGRREQVTFFSEPVDGTFLKETQNGTLIARSSIGGSEKYQVFTIDGTTNQVQLLTDSRSRNVFQTMKSDGSQVVVGSNRLNGRDMDLYIVEPKNPRKVVMIKKVNAETWFAYDWSHDGKKLLLSRYVSINETYPSLFDVEKRKVEQLPFLVPDKTSFRSLQFSLDDQSFYCATDVRSNFLQLNRIGIADGQFKTLSEGIDWDVESVVVDPEYGRVAFSVNENGLSRLYLLNDDDSYKALEIPMGLIRDLEFSPDGKSLGFTLGRPNAPSDAYSVDLDNPELTRWTFSEIGGLDPAKFVEPELIQYKSFDGKMVSAFYYKPQKATSDEPAPVLIKIHGGPESQYRPRFSAIDQYYVSKLGLAVIYPNVRGSAGYGKEWLMLDNAEKREDSVKDIGALLDWVKAKPELNQDRLAVMGGSYGGYMTLASLVNYPDRIRAGIDIVGIASFATFLKNTSDYRRDLRRAEYGDERTPKMKTVFEKIDPLNNADKIKSSLLVIHGKNDPRVPFSEAEQIADRVMANGGNVWTLYADNEGHGFRNKSNRDYTSGAIILFLYNTLFAKDEGPKVSQR